VSTLQIDWFEVYLMAQEERGFEGSFRMFLDLQVRRQDVPGPRVVFWVGFLDLGWGCGWSSWTLGGVDFGQG
jgi:hypothetical protein